MADPDCPSLVGDSVEFLWELMGPQSSCDLELRYLLTRYEALKILMGCYVRQVDRKKSTNQSGQNSTLTQERDGYSQAQSTGQSTSFSDAIGKQRYDDFSESESNSRSQLSAGSGEDSQSTSDRTDAGTGSSYAESLGDASGSQESERRVNSTTDGRTDSVAKGKGCDYEYAKQHTTSDHVGGDIEIISAQVGATISTGQWDKYYRKESKKQEDANRYDTMTDSSLSRGASVSLDRRAHGSHFNALVDSYEQSTSQSAYSSHATSHRDSDTHAEGAGTGRSEGKNQSESSSQGNSEQYEEGFLTRRSSRSGFSIMDEIRAQQRFDHLLRLLENTWDLMHYKRELLKARYKPSIGEILCQSLDGYCTLPAKLGTPCGYWWPSADSQSCHQQFYRCQDGLQGFRQI